LHENVVAFFMEEREPGIAVVRQTSICFDRNPSLAERMHGPIELRQFVL
jgi:hypothetical protein